MEAQKFKLQYSSCTARHLHSVKSIDTPAIGTFISMSHAKIHLTPSQSPEGGGGGKMKGFYYVLLLICESTTYFDSKKCSFAS